MYRAPPLPPRPLVGRRAAPLSRRPVKGRDIIGTLIHRSSALRALTDAYGTGILADADITVRASCLWAKRPTCPTRPTRPTRPTEPLSKAGDHLWPPVEWGNKRKAVHLSYYTPTDIFQHTRYEGQATVIYRGGGGDDHQSPRTGHRIDLDQQEKEVDRRG